MPKGYSETKKIGRPKKLVGVINKDKFRGLCRCDLTAEDLCLIFGVNSDTLQTWIEENYEGKSFSEVKKVFDSEDFNYLNDLLIQRAAQSDKVLLHLSKSKLKNIETQKLEHSGAMSINIDIAEATEEDFNNSKQITNNGLDE